MNMYRTFLTITYFSLASICNGAFPDAPPAPRLVAMATATEDCCQHVFHGLQDILLGWDESAHARFMAAHEADPDCALAQLGLLLTAGSLPDAQQREALEASISRELAMTPAEAALVSTGLELLAGKREAAAREFKSRVETWRADILSACWAVLLLHDGYDETGKPLPNQAVALEMIQKLWLKHRVGHPCSAIVCYLRALMEETAPVISEEALQSAQQAAYLLPTHPSPRLLWGHLLMRSGKVKEAIPHFRKAVELAEALRVAQGCPAKNPPYDWPLEMRARLYESTALWMDGQVKAARKTRRAMNAWPLDRQNPDAAGNILMRWEANTLPLRVLVLSTKVPYDGEIDAAVKAATPEPPLKNDPVLHYRDCLRFCLVARQRAHASKWSSAQKCIEAAEKSFGKLSEYREEAEMGATLSSWARACEACEIAINAAKAVTFRSTTEIWKRNSERAARAASLLMPPVVPIQAGKGGK